MDSVGESGVRILSPSVFSTIKVCIHPGGIGKIRRVRRQARFTQHLKPNTQHILKRVQYQNSLVKAARAILKMGPKYLIIKKGEHGALLFHEDRVFFAPALPLEEVFDPTGAGDTFAGGFIGHIAKTKDISFENMKTAIIVGSAMASYCVEKFGPERLKEITREDIDNRIQEFVQLVNFDIELV